jgi:hypothetical protein
MDGDIIAKAFKGFGGELLVDALDFLQAATSGWLGLEPASTFSRRALIELTFQVAIRMADSEAKPEARGPARAAQARVRGQAETGENRSKSEA